LLAVGSCRHIERVTLAGGQLRAITFPSICALIEHPREGPVLYDTGYAEHFLSATDRLPDRLYRWVTPLTLSPEDQLSAQLGRRGLRLRDIRYCIISHFHADHIAGLRDLTAARFIASQRDVEALRRSHGLSRLLRGLLPVLLPVDFGARLRFAEAAASCSPGAGWEMFDAAYDLFGDGSILALRLPGHAPGHLGLVLRDEHDRQILLCADACWSRRAWQEQRLPSMLARPLMHDWPAYRATLARLQVLAGRHPELVVLPSHCEASLRSFGREAVA